MVKETILVADDESMVLEVAIAMLEHLDYKVLSAENGQEAFDTFIEHQNEIDLLILDIGMPVMDGYQCIAEIRKISNVPALFSSGLSQTISKQDTIDHQAQGILPKPFTLETMQEIVEEILK